MDMYQSGTTKSGVPLDHLDFSYIEKCSNTKELEKILKELRSGEEGFYPDLERSVEEKLLKLDPASKALRKDTPIMNSKELGKNAYQEISADLDQWSSDMHSMEKGLKKESSLLTGRQDRLPPVRGSSAPITRNKSKTAKSSETKSRPVKPRDYRDWDKLDVEAELAKVDEPKKPAPKTTSNKSSFSNDSEPLNSTNLTDQEKSQKAECEKNKGNEAFRAGDHEEALFHYSRSIQLLPTIAAHNNRAQTYVKLKRWHSATCDCNAVLKMDPQNIKAHLRRAVAYQGQRELVKAAADLKFVLDREANNKRAEELLKEVNDSLAEQKVKGRRMVIEEVEGSDESESESEGESNEVVKEEPQINHIQEIEQAVPPSDAAVSVGDAQPGQLSEATVPEVSTEATEPDLPTGATQPDVPSENTAPSLPSESTQPDLCTSADTDNGKIQEVCKDKQTVPSVIEPPVLPDAVSKLKESGNVMFRKGQYGEAMHVYTDAINALMPDLNSQSPNMSVLYTNRAACRYKSGDCSGCVEDCSQALLLTPAAIKPLVRRAMAYEALEKFRLAYVDYRQVLNLDQTVDVAQQGSTRCGQILNQQDGPHWRERLPPVPTTVPQAAYQYPAPQQTEQQKRAEAERNRQKKLKTEQAFNAEKKLGNECVQKDDYQKAVEHYSQCVELCPDQAVAFTNRALCYLRLNKPERVIDDCNNALLIDFENAKALFRRAQAYKMQDKYEQSLIDLQTLLKIDPNNSTARKELGVVERSQEQYVRRRREEQSKKSRHPVHIQPVDVSSDEEDTPTSPPTTATRNHGTNKESNSVNSSQQKRPCSRGDGSNSTDLHKNMTSPTLNKATPYEFVHAWTSLKGITDTQPYVQLLQQISPDLLPKVVSNKLDGSMLVTIVRAIHSMISSGVYNQAFLYLSHLTKVPRFNTIALFLSDAEKNIVRGVFKQLAEHITADSVYTSQQLTDTQQSYTL